MAVCVCKASLPNTDSRHRPFKWAPARSPLMHSHTINYCEKARSIAGRRCSREMAGSSDTSCRTYGLPERKRPTWKRETCRVVFDATDPVAAYKSSIRILCTTKRCSACRFMPIDLLKDLSFHRRWPVGSLANANDYYIRCRRTPFSQDRESGSSYEYSFKKRAFPAPPGKICSVYSQVFRIERNVKLHDSDTCHVKDNVEEATL
ncbi:hypothetical protein EVAR_5272_1 [Eumeta japonica]|uniref:Uncharacterized protein n=1 Tax=Eumeta variegata TaxID=151549 RepID=A0A4C1TMQ6_EUMVA|nr:hypothetical protein EVAR_5272_1 [Eumeta japonica]